RLCSEIPCETYLTRGASGSGRPCAHICNIHGNSTTQGRSAVTTFSTMRAWMRGSSKYIHDVTLNPVGGRSPLHRYRLLRPGTVTRAVQLSRTSRTSDESVSTWSLGRCTRVDPGSGSSVPS